MSQIGTPASDSRKTKLWRDVGRPEAALTGVQYLANGKARRRPWIVRKTDAAWLFAGARAEASAAAQVRIAQ